MGGHAQLSDFITATSVCKRKLFRGETRSAPGAAAQRPGEASRCSPWDAGARELLNPSAGTACCPCPALLCHTVPVPVADTDLDGIRMLNARQSGVE